ncbi:glutathione S-transferase N-terminal domain-containing protein [Niveispirillum sp.]|uniref:glutathione S-transferase family protein n=1 Tax=Niveispirillum sp. TaxID=1917217 RepID=UPI001B7904C4|nr:glutathione S-transferase N-terminal domain-containing protein [Niveispirillum sp.]MBP7338923.1 glutathione S-transferase N-terminal domain-containing protein [Niveispirillum sp.]
MKLYQFSWGIYPRRILVYLQEKGVTDIEMMTLDVVAGDQRQPDFLKKNPAGTVPVLETDDGHFIGQSCSILLYLEECLPGPDMSGATAADRARTRDQLLLVNDAYNFAGICTFHASPLFVQRREQSSEVARAMRFEYARVLGSLEAMAGDGDYLGGDRPSIADVAFFASEQFMRTLYKLRLPEQCARLEAIYSRFQQRPSATPAAFPEWIVDMAPLRDF